MSGRTTNFARQRPAPVRRIAFGVWLVAITAVAAAIFFYLDGMRLQADARALAGHLVTPVQLEGAAGADETVIPTNAELAALESRIRRLNDIAGDRHLGVLHILAGLETALPQGVWVSSLAYDTETGRLSLSLLGEDETLLPTALQRTEQIEALQRVILERQTRLRQGQRQLLKYDISGETR